MKNRPTENADEELLCELTRTAEMGVEVKGNKKADYIAAIAAEEVEASAEDDELPPDLDVADPE